MKVPLRATRRLACFVCYQHAPRTTSGCFRAARPIQSHPRPIELLLESAYAALLYFATSAAPPPPITRSSRACASFLCFVCFLPFSCFGATLEFAELDPPLARPSSSVSDKGRYPVPRGTARRGFLGTATENAKGPGLARVRSARFRKVL